MKKSFNRICKLSQDATNELWSVTLRREYKSPAQKKRAIERVVRGAIEAALGAKSTAGGWDVDDTSDCIPIFGNSKPVEAVRNPYEKDSP